MSNIANRALATRCPIAAPTAGAMAKGSKGSYRYFLSETQTEAVIPDHLRGHFVYLQAINCRVQYSIVLRGDAVPALTLDAESTFDAPDEAAAPTLPTEQATRDYIPPNGETLIFVFGPQVDAEGPEASFEIWLSEAKNTRPNPSNPTP